MNIRKDTLYDLFESSAEKVFGKDNYEIVVRDVHIPGGSLHPQDVQIEVEIVSKGTP